MSYEFYKMIHFITLFLTVSLFGISLYSEKSKKRNILSGITSVLILVSGMGLLARIGVQHGSPFPFWVIMKMVIWLVLVILMPIWVKRLKSMNTIGYVVMIVLVSIALYAVVDKPFTAGDLF